MIDPSDPADKIENAEANDPIEATDSADPIDPIESADPVDPIESTDPREPIERNESSDQSDRLGFAQRDRTSQILVSPQEGVERRLRRVWETVRLAASGSHESHINHMEPHMPRRLALTTVALLALLLPAAPSQAERRAMKASKPSIRISGISVDTFDATPGTKITYTPNNPPNACYDIGGPGQDPYQVDVVFFIHAVDVPNNAPTTLHVVTPWDQQSLPASGDEHPTFASTWFTDRGHGLAALYGGSDAADNFYRYDDEGTAGTIFNGAYSVITTVTVHHKVLRAHGTLEINCDS